ncbi:hypothetical protein [Urbifossiella limnaea]|nr:hypothetical protein [Urbifossiella limnaea]
MGAVGRRGEVPQGRRPPRRRAAFGPAPTNTARALADGFSRTLDRLLVGEPDAAERLAMCEDAGRYRLDGTRIRLGSDFNNTPVDPAVPVRAWCLCTPSSKAATRCARG